MSCQVGTLNIKQEVRQAGAGAGGERTTAGKRVRLKSIKWSKKIYQHTHTDTHEHRQTHTQWRCKATD